MSAAAATAVTPSRMICSGENQQAARVEIKIARHDWQWPAGGTFAMKRRHTAGAETGLVSRLRRDAGEQFVRDVRGHAPARTFVGGAGAKLTAVGSAAERASAGVAGLHADWIGGEVVHFADT